MTDEERLVELEEKREECNSSLRELRRLELVKRMDTMLDLLEDEIRALEARINYQNEIDALKEGEQEWR